MERGGYELERDFRLPDATVFHNTGYYPGHSRKSESRLDEQSRTDNGEHHGDHELDCVLRGNFIRDRSARHDDKHASGGYHHVVNELYRKQFDSGENLSLERGSNEFSRDFRLYDAIVFHNPGYYPGHSRKPESRIDEQSGSDNGEQYCNDELECVFWGNVVWDRSARHDDKHASGGYHYVVNGLYRKQSDSGENLSLERGSNELIRDFRLYGATVFHHTGYHPGDSCKSESRLDEQSRTDNGEHHGDDELDCVLRSNLVWDRRARYVDQHLGGGYHDNVNKLHRE